MLTVDYTFYTSEYHGAIGFESFSCAVGKASAYLDTLTMGRAARSMPAAMQHRAKLALCALTDILVRLDAGEITAESNDGASVTYAKSAKTEEQRLYETAALYLAGTGLLYRGCG